MESPQRSKPLPRRHQHFPRSPPLVMPATSNNAINAQKSALPASVSKLNSFWINTFPVVNLSHPRHTRSRSAIHKYAHGWITLSIFLLAIQKSIGNIRAARTNIPLKTKGLSHFCTHQSKRINIQQWTCWCLVLSCSPICWTACFCTISFCPNEKTLNLKLHYPKICFINAKIPARRRVELS